MQRSKIQKLLKTLKVTKHNSSLLRTMKNKKLNVLTQNIIEISGVVEKIVSTQSSQLKLE